VAGLKGSDALGVPLIDHLAYRSGLAASNAAPALTTALRVLATTVSGRSGNSGASGGWEGRCAGGGGWVTDALIDGTGPKVPGLGGHPVLTTGRRDVVTSVGHPPDWIAGRAGVLRFNEVAVGTSRGF
jgi:hypothetical protein